MFFDFYSKCKNRAVFLIAQRIIFISCQKFVNLIQFFFIFLAISKYFFNFAASTSYSKTEYL